MRISACEGGSSIKEARIIKHLKGDTTFHRLFAHRHNVGEGLMGQSQILGKGPVQPPLPHKGPEEE